MKFSRIGLLLAACFIASSCRETLVDQHDIPQKERAVPSSDIKQIQETQRDSLHPKFSKPPIPKPSPKVNPKKQDTLKPRRAIP